MTWTKQNAVVGRDPTDTSKWRVYWAEKQGMNDGTFIKLKLEATQTGGGFHRRAYSVEAIAGGDVDGNAVIVSSYVTNFTWAGLPANLEVKIMNRTNTEDDVIQEQNPDDITKELVGYTGDRTLWSSRIELHAP